ncbi:hypothetical protein KIW84_064565 [Lathyrus oleraceus]|uniref:DUF4283 domain-containing protein n=1 Tax=Pisum sativum TaxID=3888 RepID=A0A9D5A996_PEA|nr:hypothetical protein KIW84_064565 [Pisum sativum]
MESALRNGHWSIDMNMLVLKRVYGEEQPSGLDMHFGSFWVWISYLPLILRSKVMARKIRNILETFEEIDSKDIHRNVTFLCIKANAYLKQPLKRGMMVRFKEKSYRLRHQVKDCESMGDLGEEGYEDVDEHELSYDRAFALSLRIPRFYPIKVFHLPCYDSDHVFLRIDLERKQENIGIIKQHLFRFEDAWARDGRYEEVVSRLWKSNNLTGYSKLRYMSRLREAFKEYMCNIVKAEMKLLEELLKEEEIWSPSVKDIKTYKYLENQRNNFLRTKETKVFHGKEDRRRKMNHICKLKDE